MNTEAMQFCDMESMKIEAMQFCDMESYQKIAQWMMDCGDTHALAGETKYMSNIMMFPGVRKFESVRQGEWVARNEMNEFYVIKILSV